MESPEEKIKSGALPPDSMNLKLHIQQMREFDEAKALSKERDFDDKGAAEEIFEIASRPDEYYIEKLKERDEQDKK